MVALAAVVLIGSAALALDIGVQTNNRRLTQNIADGSALAGVRDLPSNQSQAVVDAESDVALQAGLSGFSGASPSCGAGSCTATTTFPSGSHTYTVTINTPPTSSSACPTPANCLEVILHERSNNELAGVLGFGATTVGARSVAYVNPSSPPFGFALYTRTLAESGNSYEKVSGDVYADRAISPQSSGMAGFCTLNGGHIVLGYPQVNDPGYGNDGQSNTGPNSSVIAQVANCPASPGGTVNQTGTEGAGNCPTISGLSSTLTYNATIQACVAKPSVAPPQVGPPSTPNVQTTFACAGGKKFNPGIYTCATNNGSALSANGTVTFGAGVYTIEHNASCVPTSCYDLDFSGKNTYDLSGGVTFILASGATMGVEKGATLTQAPYCAGSSSNASDCKFDVYEPYSPIPASSGCKTDKPSSGEGGLWVDNSTATFTSGSIYLPTGMVDEPSNGSMQIQNGQAVAEDWCVQSGNHPAPEITYNGGSVATNGYRLRLVT